MSIKNLAEYIESWDPETGDLPDDVALAMDADPALRALFDARFGPHAVEAIAVPGELAGRVLPKANPWRWWVASGALAAAVLLVAATATTLTNGYQNELVSVDGRLAPADVDGEVVDVPAMDPPAKRAQVGHKPKVGRNAIDSLSNLGYIGGEDDQLVLLGYAEESHAELRGNTGDGFVDHGVNGFVDAVRDPRSTFSIDVDRGSYTWARRSLGEGRMPDPASVRVEEFVNALHYSYPAPYRAPLSVSFEASPGPFHGDHLLVRVGLQARQVEVRRPVHLTFLVDTSGSMQGDDRLTLVKTALGMAVGSLSPDDTVAIVAYAGSAGLVLPPTSARNSRQILDALRGLDAGGSTAMGAGIELAYRLAHQTHREGETSRVIIASDGDANIGSIGVDALSELIRGHALDGITLTTLGFGTGNYKDFRMEQLADQGDGNYFYVDGRDEARRIFVDELASTLEVVARDVKVQVVFDPTTVERYRLIGYENRDMADRDFRNDERDAGEMGAGHAVTALYDVVVREGAQGPLLSVSVRAKPPGEDRPAVERKWVMDRSEVVPSFKAASQDHRMAIVAAAFAERLRGSGWANDLSYERLVAVATEAARPGETTDAELVGLIRRAAALD